MDRNRVDQSDDAREEYISTKRIKRRMKETDIEGNENERID